MNIICTYGIIKWGVVNLETEFLIFLNNLTITNCYDKKFFEDLFEMIKNFCQATDVYIESCDDDLYLNQTISSNDIVLNIDSVKKKLVIKEPKKAFENKSTFIAFLNSIINNIFKNYLLIDKLKHEKYMDSLLKVYNRTAYDEMLSLHNILENCGVAFVDADGLGIVNNMYGHEAGDKLLTVVADCFKTSFRYYDIYRIGGDELVIICPDIDKNLFMLKLQQALNVLRSSSYTVSMGVVYNEFVDNLPKMIKEANVKMKRSKETFRKAHPEKYLNKYEVTYVGDEQDNLKKSY